MAQWKCGNAVIIAHAPPSVGVKDCRICDRIASSFLGSLLTDLENTVK